MDHARARTSIALHCAVEAKILDTAGHLDAPNDLTGVEAVYAADHQVPLPEGPRDPAAVRDAIADGSLDGDEVVASLVAGTVAAVRSHDRIVIAHLFSVLPKIGLSEDDVAPELVASLAEATAAAGARIEVSERWRCPSVRNLRPFVERGVPLLLSTDSHGCETIGRYSYCAEVVRELSGVELAGVA